MKTRLALLLALASLATAFAADEKKDDKKDDKKGDKVKSDLIAPDKRRTAVELGQHLTRPPVPEPLPTELLMPFNPPGFDLPDRNEVPPVPQPSVAGGGGGGGTAPGPQGPPAPVPGEREKLDSLAAKLNPGGSIIMGGRRSITFGGQRVFVGADFSISSNGQEYTLKLVEVDSTTFKLRLGNEEVTRSIDPKRK